MVDTAEERQKLVNLRWDVDLFRPRYESSWEEYQTNKLRRRDQFVPSEDILAWANDAGISLRHPAKPDLTLLDFFVYPDLKRVAYKEDGTSSSLKGENV